jgi:hypothetical protein
MKLSHPDADLFVPDGLPDPGAFARTTHLGVGAHQDDLEIMAYAGIEACYQNAEEWFGGIVVTNGAGSARQGPYAGFDDDAMRGVRLQEQRRAAVLGEYAFVAQLGFSSAQLRQSADAAVADMASLLRVARPRVVYVHNPADKHPTHIVTLHRPEALYGVEVWRDLDWLDDAEKVVLRTDRRPNLAQALMGLFDSQITGGKRYDLAVPGRRLANATFFEAHAVDALESAAFAIDLSALLRDDRLSLAELVGGHIERFRTSVMQNLSAGGNLS